MSTAEEPAVKHQTDAHSPSSQGKNDTQTNGGGALDDELRNVNDRRVVEVGVGNVWMGWDSWPVATDMY